MTQTLGDGETVVKEKRADTVTGTLPSWWSVTTNNNGSVTAEDASNNGGRIVIDPGTTSSGDVTQFSADAYFANDAWDILEFESIIELTTTSTTDGVFTVNLIDSAGSNGLQYSFLNGGTSINDQLAKLVSGARTGYPAPVQNDTNRHNVLIRWNATDGVARAIIDGLPSAEADVSDVPAGAYRPEFYTKYNGGSAFSLRVYDAVVRYGKLNNAQ